MKHLNKTNPWLGRISQTWAFSLKATTLLLFMFCITTSKAQTNSCGCTPTKTFERFFYAVNCLNTFTCYDGNGDSIPNNPPINGVCRCDGPDEWVQIDYYKITCGSNVGILFLRAYGVNQPRDIVDPQDPTKMIHTDFGYWHAKARLALITQLGVNGMFSYTYPAGCQAMAQVKYPLGTKCYYRVAEGPNAGRLTEYNYDRDRTVATFPCDSSNCCRLDYAFNTNTRSYELVTPNINMNCAVPVPKIKTDTVTCLDQSGNPVTHKGTVNFITACESYCDQAIGVAFKTTGTKGFEPLPNPLNFNASPVPATENITFTSLKEVNKLEIYDVTGKKVLEQNTFDSNTINISSLKNAIHYVRVYFNNGAIHTIKIVKQ